MIYGHLERVRCKAAGTRQPQRTELVREDFRATRSTQIALYRCPEGKI